jgi:hypothetical protein
MRSLIQNHTPLCLQEMTIYVSLNNTELYLNINTFKGSHSKWKKLDIVAQSGPNHVWTMPNQGTWIHSSLWESFGNWWGMTHGWVGLGNELVKVYLSDLDLNPTNDYYFNSLSETDGGRYILRVDHDSGYVNFSDIMNTYNSTDLGWKKADLIKQYIAEHPKHITSSINHPLDFGIQSIYGHPVLAFLLLDWLDEASKLAEESNVDGKLSHELLFSFVSSFLSGREIQEHNDSEYSEHGSESSNESESSEDSHIGEYILSRHPHHRAALGLELLHMFKAKDLTFSQLQTLMTTIA